LLAKCEGRRQSQKSKSGLSPIQARREKKNIAPYANEETTEPSRTRSCGQEESSDREIEPRNHGTKWRSGTAAPQSPKSVMKFLSQ
jgi:hypothetical protein